MDPFEILLNPDRVIPFYKPIISADAQLVTGYEVISYFQKEDGTFHNLDWFFNDPSIPDEFLLEITEKIMTKALNYYIKNENPSFLIFRYDTKLLYRDRGENIINFLQSYAEKKLNLEKIVIQIQDEFQSIQLDSIKNIFQYMKSLGIKIALDDSAERNGNLDRLAFLKPNIIKVDAGFLQDQEIPHLYRDVHQSLSMLSRKIGATLMFKGINTYNQLNYAWRNGGRYYQGAYLQRPEPNFVELDCCKKKIEKHYELFIDFERKKVKAQLDFTNRIHQEFKNVFSSIDSYENYDDLILNVGNNCSTYAFRVYICNDTGLQLSANAEKSKDGIWVLDQEGRLKNWSWRPYFFENIARMNIEKKGILSDLYTDIEKDELIRTYSYPISENLFIFLDIPYDYLFEQEGLL